MSQLCKIEQNRLGIGWQLLANRGIPPPGKNATVVLQPVIENAIRYGAEKLGAVPILLSEFGRLVLCWRYSSVIRLLRNARSAKATRSDWQNQRSVGVDL